MYRVLVIACVVLCLVSLAGPVMAQGYYFGSAYNNGYATNGYVIGPQGYSQFHIATPQLNDPAAFANGLVQQHHQQIMSAPSYGPVYTGRPAYNPYRNNPYGYSYYGNMPYSRPMFNYGGWR